MILVKLNAQLHRWAGKGVKRFTPLKSLPPSHVRLSDDDDTSGAKNCYRTKGIKEILQYSFWTSLCRPTQPVPLSPGAWGSELQSTDFLSSVSQFSHFLRMRHTQTTLLRTSPPFDFDRLPNEGRWRHSMRRMMQTKMSRRRRKEKKVWKVSYERFLVRS